MNDMGQLGLDLAADLAAMEIYVGITPVQLGAWRAYTSTLIGFFEPPDFDPDSSGPLQRDAPPPRGPDGRPQDDLARPTLLFATWLADEAIARGEKAKALKIAVEELRSAVTPDQFQKLAKFERTLTLIHPFGGRMQDRPTPHRFDRALPAPVREH